METTQCPHDYSFINSELIGYADNNVKEVAKVICTKCGEVKNVDVK